MPEGVPSGAQPFAVDAIARQVGGPAPAIPTDAPPTGAAVPRPPELPAAPVAAVAANVPPPPRHDMTAEAAGAAPIAPQATATTLTEGGPPDQGAAAKPAAATDASRAAEPGAQPERGASAAPQANAGAGGDGGQNGQNSGQNSGHNAAQTAGAIDASRSAVRVILDTRMQDFEARLAREVETAVRGMRSGLELSLRPRNLGEVKVKIELVQDRAQIQIVTETAAAARLLAGGEERLSQMLDQSGIRLGAMVAQAAGNGGQGGRGGDRGSRGAPAGAISERKAAELRGSVPAAVTRKLEDTETSINLIA